MNPTPWLDGDTSDKVFSEQYFWEAVLPKCCTVIYHMLILMILISLKHFESPLYSKLVVSATVSTMLWASCHRLRSHWNNLQIQLLLICMLMCLQCVATWKLAYYVPQTSSMLFALTVLPSFKHCLVTDIHLADLKATCWHESLYFNSKATRQWYKLFCVGICWRAAEESLWRCLH